MIITQQPDPYSLTGTIKDFIITSDSNILFKVKLGGDTILEEKYTPTAAGQIRIRDLGKLFGAYLTGDFYQGVQSQLAKTFNFFIDNVAAGSTTVLSCKASTSSAADTFWGQKLLTLQYRRKRTHALAKEFLTAYITTVKTFQAKIIYLLDGVVTESAFIDLLTVATSDFYTVDASFRNVYLLFPLVDPTCILSYIVGIEGAYVEYLVDNGMYLAINNFVFLNSFSVPESIICRGTTSRKGVVEFDNSKIHNIEKKYNIQRADTFTTSIGKLFSEDDYRLVREMLTSEKVKVFYAGEYREIIIIEEDMNPVQRPGSFSSVNFTFRFADSALNIMLNDTSFVLADGTWNDAGVWIDEGHMLDKPE